jgi:chromosome segregation ATPase
MAQNGKAAVGEAKDNYPNDVIAELRLTRQVIQQLKRELVDLQVVAIQIRLQQDTIANTEGRLDSIRAEVHSTEESLVQIRDRVATLESVDSSREEEAEKQRANAELKDARKEIERQQARMDLFRSQESQLTGEIQTQRAHLNELMTRLEHLGAESISKGSEAQSKTGEPNRSPEN